MADGDQRIHDADRLDIPGPRKARRPKVQLDSEKFGQFAEATARFMGTAKFLAYMTVVVLAWIIWNLVAIYKLRFDPYPFILLNLFFSTQASYSAPLILQMGELATRDYLRSELRDELRSLLEEIEASPAPSGSR